MITGTAYFTDPEGVDKVLPDHMAIWKAAYERELERQKVKHPEKFQGPPPDSADYVFWCDMLEVQFLEPARQAADAEVYGV